MTPDSLPMASIGSVFLRSSNPTLCRAVLRTLFGDSVSDRPGGWLEVSGDVDLFVEPVPEASVPESASFGIKVHDARRAVDAIQRVDGVIVGDLFEVAPSCAGFNCRGQGMPELFIHE